MAKNVNKVEPQHSEKSCFVCRSEGAQAVFLAGSFNDWDPTRTPMELQDDGSWRIEVELAPGRYEYKFVVDGAWCCEPGVPDVECAGCVPNAYGSMNRVIEVPSRETKTSAA